MEEGRRCSCQHEIPNKHLSFSFHLRNISDEYQRNLHVIREGFTRCVQDSKNICFYVTLNNALSHYTGRRICMHVEQLEEKCC